MLFSTVMFSSSSYAEWTKVGENIKATFYVDYERIRKNDGYVYYWELADALKPDPGGHFSAKTYNQGDCKLFRYKGLSFMYYKGQMGVEIGLMNNNPDKEWTYPPPNSVAEITLKQVCNR